MAAAQKRIALEEAAAKGKQRRRGLLDVAGSAMARMSRAKSPDKALGLSDKLSLQAMARKQGLSREEIAKLSPAELAQKVADGKQTGGLGGKFINPQRAAEALASAKAAADPAGARGKPAADPEQKRQDALLTAVQEIAKTFSNLATA